MPRDIPVSNGSLLVAFDKNYRIREFFFPYVGEENHTSGNPFKIGVWIDRKFSWIDEESWDIKMRYLDETMVTDVELINQDLKIRLCVNDLVDFHENIYIKKIVAHNLDSRKRDLRIFLCHDFDIKGNEIGDTAVYRPNEEVLVHYKGDRYFLINGFYNGRYGLDYYAIGSKGKQGLEGTWKDAEDGVLGCNAIEQGSVDSVIGLNVNVDENSSETLYYWISVGKNYNEACQLNHLILEKTPEQLLIRTKNYWKLWCNKEDLELGILPEKIAFLYKKSLLILRTQIDNSGGILAANDSDVMQYNRDTYSYIWPRDGALVAHSLDLAGYIMLAGRFYNFCNEVLENEGYLLHKYTPSKNVGSSWHPWLNNGKLQLPIQEDESALVLWALWHHFDIYRDIEFIKPIYKCFIKKVADFLLDFRDEKTKLPLPSYDLWEERLGIHTFTVCSVYGALMSASRFAAAFGEIDLGEKYKNGAMEIKISMEKYMYLNDKNRFARMVNFSSEGDIIIDDTLDASLYALFAFGPYKAKDEKVKSTMEQIREKLWCQTEVGGLARYENDPYYRVSNEIPGNPWFVTTLWLALYYIESSDSESDLSKAMDLMKWVSDHALESGVLAEQVNPFTNVPLSVSPLTWSHATFIHVTLAYLEKYKNFKTIKMS